MTNQNNTGGPLSGLKVVEFDGLGPTPFSAMQLADMGANVIRIARKTGTQAANQFTDVVIRNRSYIELDLKDVNDIAIAKKIVSHSDILIEGFRPGVMERLGLGTFRDAFNKQKTCLWKNDRMGSKRTSQ